MNISNFEQENAFIVKVETDSDQIIENIASVITYKIPQTTIENIRELLVNVCRFNEHPDIIIAKWFVENLLSEKEIRELIKQLEN